MADFIKGTKVKFAINIEAQGFSMDTDDFDIEVISTRESVKGYKNPERGASTDLVIYNDITTASSTGEDSASSEADGEDIVSKWYAILDTSKLSVGQLRVVAAAHIPDINADGGIRTELATARLGKLVNK